MMRASLRLKVALAFSAATIVLLIAQALGVRALAESQEERLIDSLIADDMRDLMQSYRADPAFIPPLDLRLNARVSQEGGLRVILPTALKALQSGVHEVIVGEREIHVAVDTFRGDRVYRIYDYSAHERHFKDVINALMIGTSAFALITIWLAFWLSGLLVRQIAGLARHVKTLRSGAASAINPGKYDEVEVVELVESFNDYHRRMAAMVEREKEFTGNVSHELRTPLTTIRTSCELLEQDTAIGEKSRTRLRQIEHAAHNMHTLVESLLALARGESSAEIVPLPLHATIENAVDTFADTLVRKNVKLFVEVDRDVRVMANGSALAIVLSNLIDNAIRHTEHGPIQFYYRTNELFIEDNGGGIPPEDLPHVFERFYRASARPERGLGIGLAIVKKICDHYGWSIHIQSEHGSGTRVTLGLPLAN